MEEIYSGSSWAELKRANAAVFYALRAHAEGMPNGPWTLTWFYDRDGGFTMVSYTLESMRTGEEKNGTLHRSGGSCSFSEYGTSP